MKSPFFFLLKGFLTLGICSTAFAQQFDVSYQGAGLHVAGICITCDNSLDGPTASRSGVQALKELRTELERTNPQDYKNLCRSAIASYRNLANSPEFLRKLDDRTPGKSLVLGLEYYSGVKLQYLKTVTVSQGWFRDSFDRIFDAKAQDVYFRSASDNMVCRMSLEGAEAYVKSCKVLGGKLISESGGPIVRKIITVSIPRGNSVKYYGSGNIDQFHGQDTRKLVGDWRNEVRDELNRMNPEMSSQEADVLVNAYKNGKGCDE